MLSDNTNKEPRDGSYSQGVYRKTRCVVGKGRWDGSSDGAGLWEALAEPPLRCKRVRSLYQPRQQPKRGACRSVDHARSASSAPGRHGAGDAAIQPGPRPHQARAAVAPAQPVPRAGSGSKWQRPRPRCCPGHRLPRRCCPRRRLPWCRGSGNGHYSPSVSSHRHRPLSPNGRERSHSMGQQRLYLSPAVPRAQGDVAGVALSRWTPAGGNVPIQAGDWGHHQRLGLELQSQ